MRILRPLLVFLFAASFLQGFGINYTSASSGNYLTASTWSPAGVPGYTDNVTISAGHTVTINAAGAKAANLTVNGTLSWLSVQTLTVRGNYTLASGGAEAGTGAIQFDPPGTTITIASGGTTANTVGYYLYSNRTIASGSIVNKQNATTRINIGFTLTNLGTYRTGVVDARSGSTWNNSTGSTVILKNTGFMSGRTLIATALNNTIQTNYTGGTIPTPTGGFRNLTIGGSGTKLQTNNVIVAGNLVINSNNTLNTNNMNLTIGGNWTKNGSFVASVNRAVTFNGTGGPQSISGTGTTTFENLTINNAAGVNIVTGTYTLNGVLTVSAGTFNTFGNSFTMTSTAANTARIAELGATASISGNFTIQRFISARDTTWADLSSPVQNSTFLDWDNELPAISYSGTPPYLYGSAYTYDEVADQYVAVTSSGQALTPGQGFEVFLSGDFSYTNFPNTTLNTIGVPNQGDHDLSSMVSSTAQSWNLVGNPFASNIHWADVYAASGGAASSGLYDYYEMYDYTIEDWNGFTSADAQEIPSTQGFWVYGDFSVAPTLIIPESAKTTTMVSDIKASTIQPYFTLRISYADKNKKNAHTFKLNAVSGSSNRFIAGEDIPYRKSPNKLTPSLYAMIDGKKVNTNSFSSESEFYSVGLRTESTVSGDFTIDAAGFDYLSDYSCIRLEDKLMNRIIDLRANSTYAFHMEPGDAADRFVLHCSKNGDCKAPIADTDAEQFSNEVEILPTAEGNRISFNMTETTPSTITVANLLGQNLVNAQNVDALNQTLNIAIPSDFTGMYIVTIESEKGRITKKFVRK